MSSESGEIEVEAVSGYQVLPKDVVAEIGSIKLFNKWSYEDVEIRDISLTYVHDHLPRNPLFAWAQDGMLRWKETGRSVRSGSTSLLSFGQPIGTRPKNRHAL